MKPAPFDYHRASSADEAVALLDRYDGGARILAGGQSLVPLLNMRLMQPDAVIDVNRVPGLAEISEQDGQVRIGAMTRYSAIEWSPVVGARLPLLAEVVRYVGDRQVRSRGTVGGSLAHADPTGEMPLGALALDATVVVQGPDETREITVDDLIEGPYATVLEPAEMITEIRFPAARTVSAFAEHARRHGDFCIVSVAAVGEPDDNGGWKSIRLALGGVSDRPIVADGGVRAPAGRDARPRRDGGGRRGGGERERADRRHSRVGRLPAAPDSDLCPPRARRARAPPSRGGRMSEKVKVAVTVNGEQFERDVEPRMLLVDFIRHELGLTGTHVGCEQGVCGMCTVLVDGEPIKSCLMLSPQVDGTEVTTVESLNGEELHPVQAAFKDAHGLQCGYCTPAFLMTSLALGRRGIALEGDELKEELAGVLCRCTGYQNIYTAVESYLAGVTERGGE